MLKRTILAILLLLALALPASASSQQFDLLASSAQTASGNGATIDVSGWREMAVFVHVTAGSGTLSHFSVLLESSDDNGATWFEIAPDYVFKNTGTVSAVTVTVGTRRNIVDDETAIVTADTKWTAVYRIFGNKVRARWYITVTSSPSETFSVKAVGKN